MLTLKLISTGNLKEKYLKDAFSEYEKRLGAFCKFENIELKEHRLPDNPSQNEIDAALWEEGKRILAATSQRSYKIALCVEGEQLSSEQLAAHIERASQSSGEICFIIGSSHGLSREVKSACNMRLSFSKLTFPHQLMRVMLLEAIYRSFNIIKGTKYHK